MENEKKEELEEQKPAENAENAEQAKTNDGKPTKSKKKTWLKALGIVFCVFAGLALLLICAYHGIVNYYLDKINYETGKNEDLIYETQRIVDDLPQSTLQGTPPVEEIPVSEEIDLHGTFGTSDLPRICDTKDVTNILLMATDSRKEGYAGLSDVMMLVSINQKTGKIVLCSFLRDLYAHYPTEPKNPINGDYDRLNHAHSYGGPLLTLAVLKETFNVDVKYYAKVNFNSFVQVVDAMGGLDLYLTAAEVGVINSREKGNVIESKIKNYTLSPLKAVSGMHHLNGIQVLAHARNRSIGSDFQRTERQRTIISAMMAKAKSLSIPQILNLLDVFLPLVTTNMPKEMLKDMVGELPAMLGYEIESTKIPQEGTYTSHRLFLIPDLKKNCYPLYEKIYGEAPASK
ncbi:MAG: LytR family transcriptional regulator [Ruminococcaceae bacterium]|nr:LytR family transcriptional regulator [Oscillospiraceae bacterium]